MSKTQNNDLKAALVAAGFTGDIVTPSDPDYQTSILRFAKNVQRNAALVTFVKSEEDVARVINLASDKCVPIVVRSGGRSLGGSSVEGGIVIDLSKHMNTVVVDEEKKLAYVGAGACWKDVDETTIKYGLAAVAGTVNHTGVGGVTLNGGYGWLTGEHGMVIDNLVQATLVTPDGTIRTVSEKADSDLFWAIRGGGPNFGCATEFVFRLHPQRATVYAGPLIFPPQMLAAAVEVVEEWYQNASEKEGAFLITTSRGFTGYPAVVVFVFFNGDEEEGKQRFKKIIDLGPVASYAGTIPYEQLNAMQNQGAPFGGNYHYTGVIRGCLPPPTASEIFNKMMGLANIPSPFKAINPTTKAEEPDTIVLSAVWEYHNLKKMSAVAPDATAFRMRVPHPLGLLILTWSADGQEAIDEAKDRMDKFRDICEAALAPTFGANGRGSNDTGYGGMEFGNPRSTDGARALFGDNYPRLQAIKAEYDPNMLFDLWYPIQPVGSGAES
ncbi:FAD-binding domain-containing protein [Serendipita vermifera]|nr:FAD-binding domain-containing protein [Serendipita vermifera]